MTVTLDAGITVEVGMREKRIGVSRIGAHAGRCSVQWGGALRGVFCTYRHAIGWRPRGHPLGPGGFLIWRGRVVWQARTRRGEGRSFY